MNTKKIFNICYVLPIFKDLAEAIHHGLTELGFTSYLSQSTIINEAQNILFGAHLIPDQSALPENSIIFNLEQLASDSHYCNENYFNCLKTHTVWDYSQKNIDYLNDKHINSDAVLIPIGYSPSLYRIPKAAIQDIDVLFYGAINERRKKILNDLTNAGLNTVSLTGVYGTELDHYISRSKTVINLHFHESKIFEIVRVSYLLNNKKAVISEVSADTEIEPDIHKAVIGVPYDNLVDAVRQLINDDALRLQAEENGYALFSRRLQANLLKNALFPEKIIAGSMT